MCGIDMRFDSNIGKWLSALSNSLTAFVGDVDIADLSSVNDAEDDSGDFSDAFVDDDFDEPDAGQRHYERLKERSSTDALYSLEKQLWRQTKKISELRYEVYGDLI